MRKRLLSMVLAVTMMLGLGVSASAANAAPKVYVDGTEFSYDTAEYGVPTVRNERIYVPLRVLASKLGYTVDFVDGNKATVENGPLGRVVVDLGNLESKSFTVGSETVTLDVPVAMVVNNRTLIALRGFSTALDCGVEWKDGAAWINKIAPGKAGSVENENVADGDNGIKNVISAEEFDPADLEATKKLGEDLAKEWKKTAGNNAGCDLTQDGESLFLMLTNPDDPAIQIYVSHNGDGIQISGGGYQYPAFWKVARQFYVSVLSETVSSEIQTNVMKMLDDLAKRYATNGSNAWTWDLENVSNKGFLVSDGYCLMFSDTGLVIMPTSATLPEHLRPSYPFDK